MSDDLATRVAGLLNKRLFVIFSDGQGSDVAPHVPAHFEYVVELEKRGVLFMAGPFLDADGRPGESGMLVVRAADRAEAEALAAADPFHSSGARGFRVEEWQVHEGRIQVSLDLSDQTFQLP